MGQAALRGPFRKAITESPSNPGAVWGRRDWKTYRSRDTFSWFSDGTSNQFILGEKFIHLNYVGKVGDDQVKHGDGSLLFSAGYQEASPGAFRGIDRWDGTTCQRWGLARPDAPIPWIFVGSVGFGSWHPGTSNFLLGDGSVRGFPVNTAPYLLITLTDVQDGNAASL